jgi:sugar phosphate isomerase/epimerase
MHDSLPFVLFACFACACASPTAAPERSALPPASARWTTEWKVGRCVSLAELQETKAANYDYAELAVSEIARLTEEEFTAALATHAAVGLRTPVANRFLPKELKVVGPTIEPARQMAYVRLAFDRVARLGVKLVVFGSGDARRVPEGFSKDVAFAQLVDFAKRIAPEAEQRDVTVVVEPLRQQETNMIHTAAQGLRWVQAVDHPRFQLMVDFYHLAIEGEDPQILVQAKDHILHVHFANPVGRVYPRSASEYDYASFFENLRRSGLRSGVSVEANTTDFAREGPLALAFLRAQLRGP